MSGQGRLLPAPVVGGNLDYTVTQTLIKIGSNSLQGIKDIVCQVTIAGALLNNGKLLLAKKFPHLLQLAGNQNPEQGVDRTGSEKVPLFADSDPIGHIVTEFRVIQALSHETGKVKPAIPVNFTADNLLKLLVVLIRHAASR